MMHVDTIHHYTTDIDCIMTLPPKLEGICQRHAAGALALAGKCKDYGTQLYCHTLEVQVVFVSPPLCLCGPAFTIAKNYSYCYV